MPEVSRFFGIVITMFFGDHPPPHFHARYGRHKAAIDLESLTVTAGWLPPRALDFAIEWAALHGPELRANWERAARLEPVLAITPLE